MKFLAVFFLILSLSASADVSGRANNNPSLTIGGRTFTDLTNLKILCANISGASQKFTTFRRSATSGYQVTAGKTLTIYAWQAWNLGSTALSLYLGYGDTDVGLTGGSIPTNGVYWNGDQSASATTLAAIGNTTAGAIYFTVPAAKYAFLSNAVNSITGSCCIYGYEQ